MPSLTVEKPVAACVLDAAKMVLGHLATFRMELSHQGGQGPDGLPETYGSVRQIRDHLARLVAAYPQRVELQFSEADGDMLVSVSARALELLETQVSESDADSGGAGRDLAKETIRILLRLAPGFASRPVCALPGQPEGVATRARRALEEAVLDKLRSDTATAVSSSGWSKGGQGSSGGQPDAAPPDAGMPAGGGFGLGRSSFGAEPPTMGGLEAMGRDPAQSPLAGDPGPLDPAEPGPSDAPSETTPELPAALQTGRASAAARPQPSSPSPLQQAAAKRRRPAPAAPAESTSEPDPAPALRDEDQSMVDPRLIRDPRLRSLVGMDVKGLERATKVNDFRLAAVQLRSLLAGVAWDVALQRRRELSLKGPPDSWHLPEVVAAVLGDGLSRADSLQVKTLDQCQELLHPPAQLVRPQVVTRAAVDGFRELVQRLCGLLLG